MDTFYIHIISESVRQMDFPKGLSSSACTFPILVWFPKSRALLPSFFTVNKKIKNHIGYLYRVFITRFASDFCLVER